MIPQFEVPVTAQPERPARRLPRRSWLLAVLAVVAVSGSAALLYQPGQHDHLARILAVSDGDTVTALLDGQRVKIRLWGIDAPESAQEHGLDSKAALAELVMDKDVAVEDRGGDKYGRRLAVLRVAGDSVNVRMVQLGWAWWYRRYAPRAGEFEAAELVAREARVGVWGDEEPVAPWDFRRRERGP